MRIKTLLPIAILSILLITGIYYFQTPSQKGQNLTQEFVEAQTKPDEWMYNMRAYPHNHIDVASFKNGVKQRKKMLGDTDQRSTNHWESVGPNNIGGRVTDLVYHPTDPSIIYAGSAVGGIFKSTDGGLTWTPVFDDANSASIGNIAIASSNPDILYAGTGEANGSGTSGAFFGDGIYKSTDAGTTWNQSGLDDSQHIGRVVVDAANPDRVYAACAGLLYGKSENKGLYRTLDGGDNWEKVLFISDSTSCIDVAVHPQNADIVYAVTWERIRFPWGRKYGGATSGIWKSTDGGDNWTQLTNGLPTSNDETGRIGIAISASAPDILYASYTTNATSNFFDGIYKTTDGGDSWNLINNQIDDVYASFGWYFGNVRVNPNDPDDLFVLGVRAYRSLNGGSFFENITGDMHVDFHAVEYHPQDQDKIVIGCDAGIYTSDDNGSNFVHVESLPNNQLYNCEIDESAPDRYYGGAQDNGTNRTLSGDPGDYEHILGGDGFHVAVDPVDNNYVYAEFQFGNFFRSINGGDDFEWADNGIDAYDRTNWNTPFIIDHSNPTDLYYGSQRLYKSTNRAEFWTPISGDLTDGEHPSGSQSYGTIITIAVAPTNNDYIMVGTDDGNVQITTNGGGTWENVSSDLPDRAVSEVAFDPLDETIAYVTLSGYRHVDYIPHVLKTIDNGQNWEDISGNLPEVPINDIIIDPLFSNLLIIANDVGVFVTYDGGDDWELLGTELPLTIVTDLRLHEPTRKLLAATFGRSMYTYQLDLPVSTQSVNDTKEDNLQVFPNPVIDQATVKFELTESSDGRLQLLDIKGRLIQTIKKANFEEGENRIQWQPNELPEGMYIVRLELEEQVMVRKVFIK